MYLIFREDGKYIVREREVIAGVAKYKKKSEAAFDNLSGARSWCRASGCDNVTDPLPGEDVELVEVWT